MKNKLTVIVVVLVLLGVSGYFLMPKSPSNTAVNKSGETVFDSIKDAMSKSLSLKCVYKDEKGKETTTYIKGGAVRVMMQTDNDVNQPNNIVMKDMKMHMWSEAGKTGFVYTLNPENVTPGTGASADTDNEQQASVLAQVEKYKDACKAEVVADSMFTIPTDVNFQDMSALQKQMMKGLPQGNGQ